LGGFAKGLTTVRVCCYAHGVSLVSQFILYSYNTKEPCHCQIDKKQAKSMA
jgi:hypothetical protein